MNEQEKKIVKRIKTDPYKIARNVGFMDVVRYPHNEWMQDIIFGKEDYTLLAHRGSYKSSCLSVCIALIMLINPYINILFFRKTDTDVSEMITMVEKAINSPVLQNLSNIIYGERFYCVKKTSDSINTNLYESASGATQLLGLGIKTSITGKHADLVITDDICNITDRVSRAEREKTKTQFQELRNVCNRGGRIVSLGTKWHEDDVFNLMRNIHTYTYQDTNLISEDEIQELKDSMIPSLFACNYELKIIASEDVIFANPHIGYDPAILQQTMYCHIDAAYGGEDWTAFTIAKKWEGHLYVLGKAWHKHVDNCIDEIIALRQAFNAGKIWCESNADKGYLKKELKRRGERAVNYTESMNKFIKITTYLKGAWDDIIFVDGTDKDYIQQILDFNENAEHDDCPDSLASICRLLYSKNNETMNIEANAGFGYLLS